MASWSIEKNGEKILACEHFPKRQRGVLCSVNGNEHRVLATFNSEESEEIFAEIMQKICAEK